MKKQLSHADKFAKAMQEANYAAERRQLTGAYGDDKASLKIALRELSGNSGGFNSKEFPNSSAIAKGAE